MKIEVKQDKVELQNSFITNIHQNLTTGLTRFDRMIRRICVKIADINGPRGGEDKSCRIQVFLKRTSSIIIEERGASIFAVVGKAISRVDMAMFRMADQRKERRRPKLRNNLNHPCRI
jgi:hypothetical protein